MSQIKLRYLFGISFFALSLAITSLQAQAAPNKAKQKTSQHDEKERLVLMPLRIPAEDKNLTGAMETALAKGLQLKYEVFSGEQVSQKAHEVFMKENRNTAHIECDETKCMQNIAMAFQAELIATANITKQDGGYFIALSIHNIFDSKVVQSESVTCEGCNAFKVVDKLKELVGVPATVAAVPEEPQLKVKGSDAETDLWDEVKNGNTEDDYKAYLQQYPKGKYAALANARLAKMQTEAKAEAKKKEKLTWADTQQTNSIESYERYLNDYPTGRFSVLAKGRVTKLKKAQSAEELKQQQEQVAAANKQKYPKHSMKSIDLSEFYRPPSSKN